MSSRALLSLLIYRSISVGHALSDCQCSIQFERIQECKQCVVVGFFLQKKDVYVFLAHLFVRLLKQCRRVCAGILRV